MSSSGCTASSNGATGSALDPPLESDNCDILENRKVLSEEEWDRKLNKELINSESVPDFKFDDLYEVRFSNGRNLKLPVIIDGMYVTAVVSNNSTFKETSSNEQVCASVS